MRCSDVTWGSFRVVETPNCATKEVSYCPPEGSTQPCILDACYHFDKQDSHIRGVKSTPSPSLLQFLAVSGEGRNGELVSCVVGL